MIKSPFECSLNEGILGFSNYIIFQVQENSGNNAVGQAGSGNGQMYSDESIFQGQSTEQDSSVVF